MKRYSIIRSFCVLVTLSWCMISCDGFLKESPRDALPEEEGYRNITELYLNAVASLYNYIGGNSDSQGLQGTGRGIYDLNTFTTDEAGVLETKSIRARLTRFAAFLENERKTPGKRQIPRHFSSIYFLFCRCALF